MDFSCLRLLGIFQPPNTSNHASHAPVTAVSALNPRYLILKSTF